MYIVGDCIFKEINDITVIGNRQSLFILLRLGSPCEHFLQVRRNLVYPSLVMARLNTGRINLGDYGYSTGDFGCLTLGTAHATETGGYEQMSAKIPIIGDTEFHTSGIEKGVESTMDDTLRTNIHPAAGCHLTVVGHTHLHRLVPVVGIVEHADHHRIGDDNARSIRFGREKTERMTRLYNQRLVVGQFLKVFLDKTILEPVLAHLTSLTVCNKFVGIEGDVETEVIVDHHLKSLTRQAFALILVDRFGSQITLGAPAICIDTSTRTEFVEELRSSLGV